MLDDKIIADPGRPQRRVADPAVTEMRDCLHRIEGEVLARLCPAERVQQHEERMAALDARATALDNRLTIIGEAVIETSKALAESRDALSKSAASERSERMLWLDQLGRNIDAQNKVLTQAIQAQSQSVSQAVTMLADRVGDQARRIDGLTEKMTLVMDANEALREHQENGLASHIAQAVTSAVTARVTGEAQAHAIELKAEADKAIADAEAEATKNPWFLRLMQTKVVYLPLGGWLAIAVFVGALALVDAGLASIILDWLRGLLGR